MIPAHNSGDLMARPTSQGMGGFIWLPRTTPIYWKVYINGEEVTTDIIESEFTKKLNPDVSTCRITLINVNGYYNGRYQNNQIVQLYCDLVNGTTVRFKGQIDDISPAYDTTYGYTLVVTAGHLDLNNVVVTESYTTQTLDVIFKALVSKYLPTYTVANVTSCTTTGAFRWQNKYFWDCISDLCKAGSYDAYLDSTYDFHFFAQNSVLNNNDAIVWNDTLVDTSGICNQITTIKNKIYVQGDDGTGIPVLGMAQNSANQTQYGLKELVVSNTSISSPEDANSAASAQLNTSIAPSTVQEGEAEALIMPSVEPGDNMWITNPPSNVHGQFKIYSLTHKFPSERTFVTVTKERGTLQILKQQSLNTQNTQTANNPYKMVYSWNLKFNDASEISSRDSNVQISGGLISLSSGTQGMFTATKTLVITPSYYQIQAIGSNTSATKYEVSFDGGATYSTISLNSLNIPSSLSTVPIIRVTLVTSCDLDSLGFLYK